MITDLNSFFYSAEKTSSRVGFCDIALSKIARGSRGLKTLIKDLARKGFRYAGDTNNASKANTDVKAKKIYIGKDKTLSEALLSLSYESVNAKNSKAIKKIFNTYLNDRIPTSERAMEYAKAILKVEAEAVYMRSKIALELKLESYVRNQKYIEIVKELGHPTQRAIAIEKIFNEMVENGRVHNGKIKAIDHYRNQYYLYLKKTLLLKGN